MKLYDIISNLKFIGIKNFKDTEICALTINSNEPTENGIFFCINGIKNDGHKFAETAVENGAVCLIVERYLDLPVTQIMVDDVRVAMSYISSIFFETYKTKMKFIGITGTNGKTTTTFILRKILMEMGKRVGLIGTEGIFINSLMLPPMLTTPDPIDLHKMIKTFTKNDCEFCVMEVSAHAIALNKIDDIHYNIVGLTNITKDHLDFFLTMENYKNCKASLFSNKHAKLGIINTDSKPTKEISSHSNLTIKTIGQNGDYRIVQSVQNFKGSVLIFEHNNENYEIKTNLIGDYNLSNLMLAISVLHNLNFELKDIVEKINSIEFEIPGRFNVLKLKTDYNVIIDYAHTPDGMKNIISTVKKLTNGKIITLFGCGGNRDKTKRKEMGEIATQLSDYVVITSDNPRDENPNMIIGEITENLTKTNYEIEVDRKKAIEKALTIAKTGDVVLILGKGAENYQEISGVKFHFSDYEVVDNFFTEKENKESKIQNGETN